MKRFFLSLLSLFLFQWTPAYADSGPAIDPLKIQYMYSNGSIYLRFSNGAMPGCHGNNSGRLYTDNPLFDQLYSQALTIIATGGITGKVLYTQVNPGVGGWSDCRIDGLILYPK